MEQYRRQALTQGVPCALQHYLFFYSKNAFSSLSKDECVTAFRFWVYNFRAVAFDPPTKEQLMCPMLWCRRSFEDQVSMMGHTANCQWLSNAWYWCPDCSRPETFMDCGGTGAPQCILQRKDSKVKRAVAFFKHLGHKTSVMGKLVWPMFDKAREMADTSRHAPEDAKYTVRDQRPAEIDADAEVFEMARCSTNLSPPRYELPSHMSGAVQGEEPFRGFTNPYNTLHLLEMPDRLSHAIQHELSPSEEKTELSGDLCHQSRRNPVTACSATQSGLMPSADEPSISTPISPDSVTWRSFSPDEVSPIAEASPYACDSIDSVLSHTAPLIWDQHFFMPNDLIPDVVYSGYTLAGEWGAIPSTDVDIASSRTLSNGHRGTTDATTRPTKTRPLRYLPNDRHRLWTAIMKSGPDTSSEQHSPSSSYAEHAWSSPSSAPNHGKSSVSSEDLDGMGLLIQELSELGSVVNNDWLQRLQRCPDLAVQCSNSPISKFLERGFVALKECFHGKLAHTFAEVFAIMHIACASAYMSYSEDDTYCWADLFADMLYWRHSIPEECERVLFTKVMSEISYSYGFITKPLAEHDAFIEPPTDSLVKTLKHGLVLENCKAFLHDLDCNRIVERNQCLLPEHLTSYTDMYTTNIEDMASQITVPLQQRLGIEAFRMTVVDTEFRLRSGLLRDPWEIEVTLLSSCKSYSQSRQLLERYNKAVVQVCDEAMLKASRNALQTWDPSWRDRYYTATLDLCLAAIIEIANRDRSAQKPSNCVERKDEGILVDEVSLSPKNSSPLALITTVNNDVTDVSPISTASAVSLQSSPTSTRESALTSPTSYAESTLSTSPTSSTTGPEVRCPSCGQSFRGTSCLTNLQRHRRTAKIHNKSPKYKCSYPGCDALFNRSDNLYPHFQATHSQNTSSQPVAMSRFSRRGGRKRGREVDCEHECGSVAAELE